MHKLTWFGYSKFEELLIFLEELMLIGKSFSGLSKLSSCVLNVFCFRNNPLFWLFLLIGSCNISSLFFKLPKVDRARYLSCWLSLVLRFQSQLSHQICSLTLWISSFACMFWFYEMASKFLVSGLPCLFHFWSSSSGALTWFSPDEISMRLLLIVHDFSCLLYLKLSI